MASVATIPREAEMGTNRQEQRRGSVTPLVAVLLVALIGAAAFVLDGGLVQDDFRNVQAAADAAAMSAAAEIANYGTPAGAEASGQATALANLQRDFGTAVTFTQQNNSLPVDDGQTNVIAVNVPPLSGYGPTAMEPLKYAEVIIICHRSRILSWVFGSSNLPISARAVARVQWNPYNVGILLLDPSMKGALTGTGNGGSMVTGTGAVIINSNDPAAGLLTGSGHAQATMFDVTGVPGTSTS